MRILFLGGTSFVGRHMVEIAIERGHEITLFHRGRTGLDLFPNCEHVLGDRDTDLSRLADRSWDAAIDVCAYVPRHVAQAAHALRHAVGRYCLVSTISAFDSKGATSLDEDSRLLGAADLLDPTTEMVEAETYGPLKGLCEDEAQRGFGDRIVIVRPTYVIGPHDVTDRFTYWVRRAQTGGEILAAGPRDAPIQLIDARDLGALTIRLLENDLSGAFCAVGPVDPIAWADLLDVCREIAESAGSVTWVDPDFLRASHVDVETALPLWRPPAEFALMRCAAGRSVEAGLTCRPLRTSASDTLAWDAGRSFPPLIGALGAESERTLLAAWRGYQDSTDQG